MPLAALPSPDLAAPALRVSLLVSDRMRRKGQRVGRADGLGADIAKYVFLASVREQCFSANAS